MVGTVMRFARCARLPAVALSCALLGLAPARAQERPAPAYDVLPVPVTTIYPGDIIQPAMLRDANFLPGTLARNPVYADAGELVGKKARRTLVPDRLIARNAVAEPELVARGALTRAVYEIGGLSMAASVLALQDGMLGQLIQVRNVDSGRILTGVVQADGTVRLGAS